jgi:hypothetical protein
MYRYDDLAERKPFLCWIPVIVNASNNMIVTNISVSVSVSISVSMSIVIRMTVSYL